MKRKLFTFLVAFLATLSGAVWGQEPTEVVLQESDKEALKLGDGIYHVTGSNKKGIQIKRGTTPTIILDGIKIEVTGAAIEVNGGAKPTFILQGVNKIVSEEGAAIRVPRDAEGSLRTGIVFSEASTGLLNIQVNNGGTAIGVKTAGQCGDITINGGTIQTNGKISNGATLDRDFTMSGNAVLITKEIDWNNAKKSINGGILFENSTTGKMYGDVTLNSPLPEGYVVDLTKTLTIGEGNSINKNQVHGDLKNLNAYEVKYGSKFTDDKFPLPANNKYYGPGYTLASWNAGFEQQMPTNGNKDDKLFYAHTEKTGWILGDEYCAPNSIQKAGEIPSNVESLTYQAAWYLREANLKYDTDGYKGNKFPLGYPEGLPFAATVVGNIAEAGLTVNENQVSGNGKATAGKHELTLNYTTPDGATGKIVANVEGGTYDMKDPSQVRVEIPSTAPYKAAGYRQDDIVQVFVRSNDGITEERITEGYSVECNGESFPETGLVNAGEYTITVKANEGSNLIGESPELSFEITPKKVGVTAEPLQWQLGSDPKVEPTFRINWADVFEADIEGVQLAPYTADLSSYTEAGSYSKIYTGVKLVLTGSATGNYYCDPDITGDLVVLEAPITSFDFLIELDEEITYFGGAVDIYLQVVYDKDKIAATNEYTATYYKKIGGDWLPMTSAPIHVGEYMVVVKGNGELLQDKEEKADFKITPRPLTVSAQPIEWKQGEDTQKEVMFSITEGLLPIDAETVHVKKMSIDVSDWTPGVYEDVNYSDYKGGVKLGGTAAEDYYIKGSVTGRVSIEAPKPEPSDPKIDVHLNI